MKKFDIKDVFSWSNAEKAKEYVGKLGYFGDSLEDINKWVQKYPPDFLFQILGKDEKKRFMVDDPEVFVFKLFLPAIKVIEIEEKKQYRPFTADEFLKLLKVGDVIKIKHPRVGEVITLITSIRKKTDELTLGCLSEAYSFKGFFENGTEIFLNNKWQPFGIQK